MKFIPQTLWDTSDNFYAKQAKNLLDLAYVAGLQDDVKVDVMFMAICHILQITLLFSSIIIVKLFIQCHSQKNAPQCQFFWQKKTEERKKQK